MNIQVLYEDNHIIAVNKPAGLLTQSDYSGDECVLDVVKSYLKEKYKKPGNVFLGVAHRLDRQVSGALLLARTSKAASRLFEQFKTRGVCKLYCAVVEYHRDDAEKLDSWNILTHGLRRERDITIACDNGRADTSGELRYRIIEQRGQRALVLIQLITGKKHQIRAQLSAVGLPIAGDVKYGARSSFPGGTITLHSLFLRFSHPTKNETISIAAPIPPLFLEAFPDIGVMPEPEGLVHKYARELIT